MHILEMSGAISGKRIVMIVSGSHILFQRVYSIGQEESINKIVQKRFKKLQRKD